ncbi:unnamed protein product [Chrysoparadoxa australica]
MKPMASAKVQAGLSKQGSSKHSLGSADDDNEELEWITWDEKDRVLLQRVMVNWLSRAMDKTRSELMQGFMKWKNVFESHLLEVERRHISELKRKCAIALKEKPPRTRNEEEIADIRAYVTARSNFPDLSLEKVNDFCQCVTVKTVNHGEVICSIGDDGHEAYFIFSGTVNLLSPPGEKESRHGRHSQSSGDNHEEMIVAQLKARTIFGEVSVHLNLKRTLTAVAVGQTELLVISDTLYNRVLRDAYSSRFEINQKLSLMKDCDMLNSCPMHRLARLTYSMNPVEIHCNRVICRKGDPITAVYLVESGEVELQTELNVPGPGSQRRKSRRISMDMARVGRGTLLGDSGMLQVPPVHTVTAIAKDAAVCYVIPLDELQRSVLRDRESRQAIMESLQLRTDFNKERVSRRLSQVAEFAKMEEETSNSFNQPMQQNQYHQIIHTKRRSSVAPTVAHMLEQQLHHNPAKPGASSPPPSADPEKVSSAASGTRKSPSIVETWQGHVQATGAENRKDEQEVKAQARPSRRSFSQVGGSMDSVSIIQRNVANAPGGMLPETGAVRCATADPSCHSRRSHSHAVGHSEGQPWIQDSPFQGRSGLQKGSVGSIIAHPRLTSAVPASLSRGLAGQSGAPHFASPNSLGVTTPYANLSLATPSTCVHRLRAHVSQGTLSMSSSSEIYSLTHAALKEAGMIKAKDPRQGPKPRDNPATRSSQAKRAG